MASSSVRITFANLWTDGDEGDHRVPLPELREGGHVHGMLTIEIAGRAIPHLGYFGLDDVCFDTWLVELCNAVNALEAAGWEYTFDEHEQGQPAFHFSRAADDVAFSINASVVGGGRADPEWQNVRFAYRDFQAALIVFAEELREHLREQTSGTWERWWPPAVRIVVPKLGS